MTPAGWVTYLVTVGVEGSDGVTKTPAVTARVAAAKVKLERLYSHVAGTLFYTLSKQR